MANIVFAHRGTETILVIMKLVYVLFFLLREIEVERVSTRKTLQVEPLNVRDVRMRYNIRGNLKLGFIIKNTVSFGSPRLCNLLEAA